MSKVIISKLLIKFVLKVMSLRGTRYFIYIEVKNDEPDNPYLIIKNNNKKKEVVIKLLINGDNSSKII